MKEQVYMGRNIHKDELGYYITFNTQDEAKTAGKAHFASYAKALKQMNYMLEQGHNWFNAHIDPTI